MNNVRSDFLFSTPSFISGFARVLDLYGTYDVYDTSSTEREADFRALSSDWHVVGQDIFGAMTQYACALPAGYIAPRDELSADDRQMSLFR